MTDPLMSQRTNGGGGGYLSAGLTWPRRVRPNSLSFRPLRNANPGQSPEWNMDSPQPFLSPPIQQRSGYVSPLRAVRTLKEYDQEIEKLRKENFNLKLSLYFLERDMEKITNPEERETLKVNLQLRIEAETLRNEVATKATQLHETMVTLEKLEEKLNLETQHSKEIQMKLEGKIEALKQELEERMQTPRSSEAGSEIYRQAFGIEDILSGKSSPEHEMPVEDRSQYISELEKLRCTVDEKDKEIKNMRTVIEDLEQKNKLFEEKVRKRNIAIQGLFQIAKKKENPDNPDHPQGALQKFLMQAIEAAHTGNTDSVLSNLYDIKKGLSELLSVPGSEVSLSSFEDIEHLKSEISKKDSVIQTLEEQLINQNRRVRSLEENANGGLSSIESVKVLPISSNAILEQECERLQKATRQKDHFIQELLDERAKMTSEHEKTVRSLVSQLQNPSECESGKIKDSDICGSESLKMLQELICEKDAEIDVRKKTIELLNFQLAKCQSELQAAITSGEEKECKLIEFSSRALELENELTEIQHEMQLLKATHQNGEVPSRRGSFGGDQSDVMPGPSTGEISKPLIDLDDSLKSTNPPEKKHASLSEIKELQRSLEESMPVNVGSNESIEFRGQSSSSRCVRIDDRLSRNLPSISGVSPHRLSAQIKSSVGNKEISESICLKTPRNEIIKLSFNVSKKLSDDDDDEKSEKSEDLLDIMENNIEEFERHKLLKHLKDQNIEIAKLGRHATLQEDMASVLAEDKKRLQQEVEDRTSEIQMLTAGCNDLEKRVISLQSQLHTAVKRADELERIVHDNKSKPRTPVPKSSTASQTDCRQVFTQDSECNTTFSDLESNLTSYGQSDSINTLKGEVCILILMVEEKEKEIHMKKQSINKLKSELRNMVVQSGNTSQLLSGYSEGLSTIHQQLNESQDINNNLLHHLQEVARFMETLLSNEEREKLDVSSLTPEAVSSLMKHICDSIELSENLSQNLSICEESKIFDPDECSRIINESLRYPHSEFLKPSRISWVTDEVFASSSRRIEPEGSELQVVPHQQNANGAGKSWKQTFVLQHKPAIETVVETFDSDQLTILGDSSSEEKTCCLNEQKVPDTIFSDEVQVVPKGKQCEYVRPSAAETEMRKKYLRYVLKDSMQFECDLCPHHLCCYRQDMKENDVPSCVYYSNKIDAILPLETYHKHSGVPFCNISSDSDIWSEPDRNLSLQRIGIDLEAPSFHSRSPPKRRKSTRDRQCSGDHSSDSSFSINGIPKGKNNPRRKKSIGSFRRDAIEPKLDTLVESRLLALERSIADKLTYAQKLSQTIQVDISALAESADTNSNQVPTLMNINEEINNIQSSLANAMEEVKILKDTTQESSQLSQDLRLTEELKLYNEEILSKIDDIDQMKEILVRERCARESAEQNLYSCHRELSSVKQKLGEAIIKLQEKSPVKQGQELISKKSTQELRQETGRIQETSEGTGTSLELDHLRRSLAQEEERNMFLNKQVNDILNENKILKIASEQLQFHLMSEQKNFEEVRQQLMSEQDIVKQLNKEKNISESKSVDLSANMMRMKASLTELQDHNKALSKQISDLLNENKKMKLEVETGLIEETSEGTDTSLDLDHLRRSLAQEEERNMFLNKQVNDILNENKNLKMESEQQQFHLMSEQKNLEEVRQQLMSEQDIVKQLNKEKNLSESKSVDLSANMMHLEASLTELQDQNKALSKQISDLLNENKKMKLEVETGLIQEMSEGTGTSLDLDHLQRSLAQEEERNMFLNKQVNDILNENKNLKIASEQLQFHLMSEQKNLEEIRQQLMSDQDMVKQLNKEKNVSESKSVDLSANMMHLEASLTEFQDQNKALSKQISDLLNENKKMKLEVEESQVQLNSEREQLEKLNREQLRKQESLSQFSKEKLVAENKIASLTAEVETLKIALSQKEDQNSSLNKQINDLQNDNWRIKKEMEQLELRLRTEVEHLEAVRKANTDLHKQNMDLVTQKGDIEKRLLYSEERMKVLSDEKTDLSKQIFKEQRENNNLSDQLKILEDQKVLLERENCKYKTEIHSSDSVCDEARYDLKQTKEKLKKLELKLRQYENELTRVNTSNEHLMSDKKSLADDLESLASKVAELGKQNGEVKKLLKERTNNYNETEREKSLLIDQIENLRVKKVQAESSRDKLLSDYDSFAMKVDGLERQLKDSELSLQKNKDEQEHLRQQTISLQNKIKLKESVIKDLEEQHDVLHEQLKDLQHSLNKSDIDLKHFEDENHSLELQVITLQKNLKKTSSHLEMKDGEISHLQEDVFNLEQKIKDKESAQKRILEEKKASEDQILQLQQEIKKHESVHKNVKLQAQDLEEQVYALEQQLQSKELMRKKSEEEVKSLQTKVEEKEKSVKKFESSLKKLEHKLSTFQDNNVQLQHKVNLSETARKFSEDQTAVFREELNKLREGMLIKVRKEGPASTDNLSTILDQLNSKEEYCKALENKVIEYQKQILNLHREYDRVTAPVIQLSESGMVSTEGIQIPLIPNKVFSEPRSSQDYRLHTESKIQGEKDNLIKGLELDNSDLKHQIQVLNKKFEMAEKVKREVEEENLSLWKTLYGSQGEKTDIIKTLELKNSELKNQVGELEKRLDLSEKFQQELEEEKNSLWKTLYGKQDEETDMIKRLEQKNKEFRDQLEVFQSKLREAEESKQNLREEKDSLWKTIHGKKDEKTDIFKKLQLKNNEFKGQLEDLQKKLDACEKAKCNFEEEKNSLWKTLYGQHDDKTDITKMLEGKNKELKVKIEVLEKKLSHCEKAKFDIEEKKNTLWKTMYGSQDEKTDAMKMMEGKNNELKAQVVMLEKKLVDADETRTALEEEKNSMWKTLCGNEDEKTDLLQQKEMKNVDLKGEIEVLKRELISSEKANKELEEEKSSLWKTLYGSEHEKADIIRSLEVKNNDLKGQVHILEKKLDASEKVKKDLEERINSLRVTLYGSQGEKADAVRSIELKNSDLLAQVELLKGKVSDLEKDKNEVEEEKQSLWRTLCGSADEKTDVMRLMEQKNNDLNDQIQVLQNKQNMTEKTLKEMEDEKNSLWKTLYGSEHEKSDMIKRLEQKNKELISQVGELEKKLDASEKTQKSLADEKRSLWMGLHGSDDEKTHEIKSLEMKNSDLKSQLDILEEKLSVSEKLKNDFEEEKNSLWKNMYGSQDEKAATIKKLNMENSDLKSLIQNLEKKLSISEKAKSDMEIEKNSLNERLHQSTEENANLKSKLELKDSDLKNQMEMLAEKLRVSEDLKKAIEEDRNSLYNQLLGDSSGTKLDGMLKETQIYADQVKKLQQEIGQKNALLMEMKEKVFASENSLTTQQNIAEHMKREISSYKMELGKAHAEREWFQNQYIDSQREVIRATNTAALAGSEVREEDMVMVHRENVDLKKQVAELLSHLHEKETPLSMPPVRTDLFTIKLPTLPDDKVESSADHRNSFEIKRAEMEKLHIEQKYLQKVLTDLKKQMESQPIRPPDSDIQPKAMPIQKQQSDFSEDIAKQLAYGFSDATMKEKIRQLQNERDYFKNIANNFQSDLQLRTSSPLQDTVHATYIEAENLKLHKENADLKSKMVQLHSRLKKREAMIRALSSKVVELSQSLKDSKVAKELSETERETDSLSLLASQIVEGSTKIAERSLSEDIVIPDISSYGFDSEEDSQLLSFLHPSLRLSVSAESDTLDLDKESVRKLRYQIGELENHLEDTKMDNYRLQDEVRTLLLKFGIQNNQLVCAKCGKSADITSTQPSTDVRSGSKFVPFRTYLEKDPMFSKEESINKLSECKWKLQNDVLNMQKKLYANNPHYLENQESFNNHITKIVAMEYPKIPVRIFSEPLLHTAESRDVVKSGQRLELLWKNQVLHLERDIKCLQNYRTFLEQFVLGLMKELTEATKVKPTIISRGTDVMDEQSLFPEIKVLDNMISKPPQQVSAEEEPGVKSLSFHSLSFTPEYGNPTLKTTPSQEAQLLQGTFVGKKPTGTEQVKSKAEVIDLQNKIKELNKKIEGLQLENKKLHAENKMLSLECKKCYRNKSREEKQMEKQIEDLKHSLKDLTSINRSMQLELDLCHQVLHSDGSRDKPAEKHLDDYVKKSYVMKLLGEVKSLNLELNRMIQENSMLRKKLNQLSSPASRTAKPRILVREESSSDKESEGTVTLSRSGSLSSLESGYRYEMHAKKHEVPPEHYVAESKHFQEPWGLSGIHYGQEAMPFRTTQRRGKSYSIQDRSHFSSPDLGIESDPNHELLLSEQAESDEKSCMRTRPPKQAIIPSKRKPESPSSEDTVTAIWDSVKTAVAVGSSLHAMGPLKDYTLLKKEIEESLVLVKSMFIRARQCVEYLSRDTNPNKNLGYTTLKDVLNILSDLNVCQVKAQQLVRSFWVSTVPAEENYIDVTGLLQENQDLLRKLEIIMEERKKQKLELQQAFERLREAQDSKQKMEKAIAKQLTRTKKVLKSAKSNLQGPEQQQGVSSYVPQKKNNPSSSNKPSAK